MRRFRFRLGRVETWRHHLERQRRLEHAAAVVATARTAAALHAQERALESALDALARTRRGAPVAIEAHLAAEASLAGAAALRNAREAEHAATQAVAGERLARLIEARKGLETIRALRKARFTNWVREVESEVQKHADEMHRVRRNRQWPGDEPPTEGQTR